jgi:hypothetical protein
MKGLLWEGRPSQVEVAADLARSRIGSTAKDKTELVWSC